MHGNVLHVRARALVCVCVCVCVCARACVCVENPSLIEESVLTKITLFLLGSLSLSFFFSLSLSLFAVCVSRCPFLVALFSLPFSPYSHSSIPSTRVPSITPVYSHTDKQNGRSRRFLSVFNRYLGKARHGVALSTDRSQILRIGLTQVNLHNLLLHSVFCSRYSSRYGSRYSDIVAFEAEVGCMRHPFT